MTAGALPGLQHERLHRRRELQERHPAGRRRGPGLEPRQPVPPERGPGVPRAHPELQGRVREGLVAPPSPPSPRAAATSGRATCSCSTRTRAWWRRTRFAEERGEEKPTYERFQGGPSVGGPIIADKMTFFGVRTSTTGRTATRASSSAAALRGPRRTSTSFLGTFDSPFRSHLGFAKLSYQPSAGQTRSTSATACAHESEIKDFGDQRALESATDFTTDVDTATAAPPDDPLVVDQRGEPHLPALQVEHAAPQPGPDRPGLPGRAADRRRGHRAALRAGPPGAAQRLSAASWSGSGSHAFKAGRRAEPDELRRHQVLHGEPGLPLPLDRELRVPVRGPDRLGRSRRSTPTTRSSASSSRTTGTPPRG